MLDFIAISSFYRGASLMSTPITETIMTKCKNQCISKIFSQTFGLNFMALQKLANRLTLTCGRQRGAHEGVAISIPRKS